MLPASGRLLSIPEIPRYVRTAALLRQLNLGRFDEALAIELAEPSIWIRSMQTVGSFLQRPKFYDGAARRSGSGFQESARAEPRCCGPAHMKLSRNLCDAGAAAGCFAGNRPRTL